MSTGEHQVGGDHYKGSDIDPKDFCIANDMGGCELSIIKYVTRWPKKGGIEDLRKARQFIGYLVKSVAHLSALRIQIPYRGKPAITAHQYVEANKLTGFEAEVVRQIYFWHFNHQESALDLAMNAIDAGIREQLQKDLS